MPIKRKLLIIFLSIVLFFSSCYAIFVFSNIPFVAKWRTIYIETAMSTMTHQWLAEWFIPQGIIDEVMAEKRIDLDSQKDLESVWAEEEDDSTEEDEVEAENQEEKNFYETYWELDTYSFKNFLENNPVYLHNGYENLYFEDFDKKFGIYTAKGNPVLVVNIPEKVIIVEVSGSTYQGKLAIVKDAAKVDLVKSKSLGSFGQEVGSYAADYDAVIAINASMFSDKDGHGSGGVVKGCLVLDGVDYGIRRTGDWKFLGFKYDNRMYISRYENINVADYRWAIEVFPALIVNGECVVDGTFGMGMQPRTSVAQTLNGDVILMVIDGRQIGYSIGCTVSDCAKHLIDYGAYQAINVDGGSSSVMFYNGKQITRSSSATGRGRYVPDAIIVNKYANMTNTNDATQ